MEHANDIEVQRIQTETEFVPYINLVSTLKDCRIILAVKDTVGFSVQPDGYEALRLLGLSKLDGRNRTANHWKGYIAIAKNGKALYEKVGRIHEPVFFEGNIDCLNLDIVSAPFHGGNTASILVDGKEYSVNQRGFNIVVISPAGEVIDSAAFDTHAINRNCKRLDQQTKDGRILPNNGENLFNRRLQDAIQRLDMNRITKGWRAPETRKIKARVFFFGWYILWTAIESFVEALENDPKFDVLIIIDTNDKRTWKELSGGNHKIVSRKIYNMEEDSPDITIYNSSMYASQRTESVILSAFVGAGLNDGGMMGFGTSVWQTSVEEKLNADLYITEKHLAMKSNWYGVGNPKFDVIYRNIHKTSEIPKAWEKLKGKTIILWAPDHKWAEKSVSFDLYARPFLDYFQSHTDMALIVRMHPSYPNELIGAGVWTEGDLQRLVEYINSFSNMVWDDRKDYGLAYSMADAVVTDINCGITISSLPLDVPVAVTLRWDGETCRPNFPDVLEALYQIHDVDEAYKFFFDVKNGRDERKEKRKLVREKYVAHFDGRNGSRIKELIEEKYFCALEKKKMKEKSIAGEESIEDSRG